MLKKIFYIIFFCAVLGAIFWYWKSYKTPGKVKDAVKRVINDKIAHDIAVGNNVVRNIELKELKKEVFTGGALRGNVDFKSSFLTVSGVVAFSNIERQKYKVPILKNNPKLNRAAETKLKDMFEKQYFEHISPKGKGPSDLALEAGYEYIMVGENLALGNYKGDRGLVEAWMNSPGHRENILNPKYTEIGVAVKEGFYEGKKVWMSVQEFGKPASDCPKVDEDMKPQIESFKKELDSLEPELLAKKTQLEQAPGNHTEVLVSEYNRKVAEFNALVKIYNNKIDILKGLAEDFNAQVRQYNICLEK